MNGELHVVLGPGGVGTAVIEDIGRALVTLGAREEALGQVWHLPCPKTQTTCEVVEIALAAAASDAKPQVAPPLLLRILGVANPDVRGLVEILYQFEQPYLFDHSKYRDVFDAEVTPMSEAVEATVAWFRDDAAR
jgi:nucleoside-diphosphate-sugar epimerase